VRCDSWRDKTQGGAVYYKGIWVLLFLRDSIEATTAQEHLANHLFRFAYCRETLYAAEDRAGHHPGDWNLLSG
jgi:hypothetical protein